MKCWTDKMSQMHDEMRTAAIETRVLAYHAQSQSASWHHREATIETQREAAEWHAESIVKLDAWIEADDRLRAFEAARDSRVELLDEVAKWRAAARQAIAIVAGA